MDRIGSIGIGRDERSTMNAIVDPMLDPALLAPERIRPLKRVEYEALIDAGLLEDERVELLRGVLVEMSPQGHAHSRLAAWFARELVLAVQRRLLTKDRKIKTEIYAEAGVPEYWIVDLQRCTVEVLTNPRADGYAKRVTKTMDDVLRPSKLRGVSINLRDVPFLPFDSEQPAKKKPAKRKRRS
jgi:Uma2 family endonuclease